MSVTICHEWLTNVAGSELVFKALAEAYPDARLIAGIVEPTVAENLLPGRRVESLLPTSWRGSQKNWQRYAPLLARRWSTFSPDSDLTLISSHTVAHWGSNSRNSLVYYHSPLRAAWRPDLEAHRLPRGVRALLPALAVPLRRLDRIPATWPDVMVANSTEIRNRLAVAYGRGAEVIHPPVALEDVQVNPREEFALALGRLVGYKRFDVAVQAATLSGNRLIVAGEGPDRARLQRMAGPTVTFLGRVSEREKWNLLSRARCLVFPGVEDFGIVPVEALGSGTPVIGLASGGLLDIVSEDTGVLIDRGDAEAFAEVLNGLNFRSFDQEVLKRRASAFSTQIFQDKIKGLVDESFCFGA